MGLLKVIGKRFSRNRLSLIGAVIVLFLITVSLLAPFIAPCDPTTIDVYNVLSPPDKVHLLGTDELGRDLLSRIIWGSRVSLKVGFVAVGIAIMIGIIGASRLLRRQG
jgi:peptide/nickel transport system permease protein